MGFLTILLFFIYTYGMGFSTTFFLNYKGNFLERNIMRVGLGLAIFVFISVLFGIVGVPLDWKIFFILSVIGPIIFVSFNYTKFKIPIIKLKKSHLYVLAVICMFFITLSVYNKGSFSYSWMEDDDSWNHATGVKYVTIQRTIKGDPPAQYIDPYPPGYDILMGVLHQTEPSLQWTLKFFNNLIIALGILFFYFFVLHFTGKRGTALFSTFVLFSIPSYLSHFIWAHTLVVTLFLVSLYCIEMIKKDKRWIYAAIVAIASTWLVQPTNPLKFFVLFVVYVSVKCIVEKKVKWDLITAVIGGYLLAFIWWFNHLEGILPGKVKSAVEASSASGGGFFATMFSFVQKAFPPSSGTATRAYTFREIVFVQHNNMINNPIGIGLFISILIALGTVAILLSYKGLKKEENSWKIIALICAILTFLGFNTMTFNLPIGFISFRFWMLFALFGSIVAAEGIWLLFGLFKRYKFLILSVFAIGILLTSAHQKYSVNTVIWPPGLGWAFYPPPNHPYQEAIDYAWIKDNLPIDTNIFTFVDSYVLGFDMYACLWCEDINKYRETAINQTASDLNLWLKSKGIEYLIIDQRAVRKYGVDVVNNKLQELLGSGGFTLTHRNSMFVLKVV